MDILALSSFLLVSGYIINKKEKNPRNKILRTTLSPNEQSTGEHIYSTNQVAINEKFTQDLMNERYSGKDANVIVPNTTIGRDNSMGYANIQTQAPISQLTGKTIENFSTNQSPYFRGNIGESSLNFDSFSRVDPGTLDPNYSADLKPLHKKAVESLFKPVNQNPTTKTDSFLGDIDRYKPSGKSNSINPFLQDREKPLFTTGSVRVGDDVSTFRHVPKMIEDLNVKERPILKNVTQAGAFPAVRAEIKEIVQNKSDTYFKSGVDNANVSRFGGSAQKINEVYKLTTNKTIHNLDGIPSSTSVPSGSYVNNSFVTSINKLHNKGTYDYQSRNKKGMNSFTSNSTRESFTPNKTTRQETSGTYSGNVQSKVKSRNVVPMENRLEKQTIDTPVNTNLSAAISKDGVYSSHQNFQARYTMKEANVNNTYMAPLDAIKKDGVYQSSEVQLRKNVGTVYSHTPGASSNKEYNNSETLGSSRTTHKGVVSQNYLNNANIVHSFNSSLTDYNNTKNKSTMDSRLEEDALYIPQQFIDSGLVSQVRQ